MNSARKAICAWNEYKPHCARRPKRQHAATANRLVVLSGNEPGQTKPPEFSLSEFRLPENLSLEVPARLFRQQPDILASEANCRQTVLDALKAVADILVALEQDANEVSAMNDAFSAVEAQHALVEAKYYLGSASTLDIPDISLEKEAYREKRLSSGAKQLVDTALLFQALGGQFAANQNRRNHPGAHRDEPDRRKTRCNEHRTKKKRHT